MNVIFPLKVVECKPHNDISSPISALVVHKGGSESPKFISELLKTWPDHETNKAMTDSRVILVLQNLPVQERNTSQMDCWENKLQN